MRYASIETSCVADPKATTSAKTVIRYSVVNGSVLDRPSSPVAIASCEINIHDLLFPSNLVITGNGSLSMTGAQMNFIE